MNGLSYQIKKFMTNKNTVTIVLCVVGLLVLYFGYNYRINQKTSPTNVPYARVSIPAKTQITSDMIGTVDVPLAMIKGDVITNHQEIIGKYVNADCTIPEGSLFYKRAVVERTNLVDSFLYEYPDGYVPVNLSVTTALTYGNKMYPGNYIDIYVKAVNKIDEENITNQTEDKIMVGKLIKNVKILAVLDASGNDVFADLENVGTPSIIIFAVPEEYHILLRKAMYLRTYDVQLIPVPTNESLKKEPGEVSIASEKLKEFINTVTEFTDLDLSDENQVLPNQSPATVQ